MPRRPEPCIFRHVAPPSPYSGVAQARRSQPRISPPAYPHQSTAGLHEAARPARDHSSMNDQDAGTAPHTPISSDPDPSDRTAEPIATRLSRVPLWAWPAGATLAVAVAGQAAGSWWAAVLIVLLASAALTTILAALDGQSRSRAIAISVLVAVVAVGGLIAGKTPIDELTHAAPAAVPASASPDIAPIGPGANLRGANLAKKSLAHANLRGADLSGANLAGTDLTAADLTGAVLRGTDLHDACLRHAQLSGAVLAGTDFTGADVREASIHDTSEALPAAWPPTPSALVTCTA